MLYWRFLQYFPTFKIRPLGMSVYITLTWQWASLMCPWRLGLQLTVIVESSSKSIRDNYSAIHHNCNFFAIIFLSAKLLLYLLSLPYADAIGDARSDTCAITSSSPASAPLPSSPLTIIFHSIPSWRSTSAHLSTPHSCSIFSTLSNVSSFLPPPSLAPLLLSSSMPTHGCPLRTPPLSSSRLIRPRHSSPSMGRMERGFCWRSRASCTTWRREEASMDLVRHVRSSHSFSFTHTLRWFLRWDVCQLRRKRCVTWNGEAVFRRWFVQYIAPYLLFTTSWHLSHSHNRNAYTHRSTAWQTWRPS